MSFRLSFQPCLGAVSILKTDHSPRRRKLKRISLVSFCLGKSEVGVALAFVRSSTLCSKFSQDIMDYEDAEYGLQVVWHPFSITTKTLSYSIIVYWCFLLSDANYVTFVKNMRYLRKNAHASHDATITCLGERP